MSITIICFHLISWLTLFAILGKSAKVCKGSLLFWLLCCGASRNCATSHLLFSNFPFFLFSLFPPFPPIFSPNFALSWKNDFKITFLSQGWPWTTQGSKLAFIVPYSDIGSTLPMDCSWQSQLLNRITMKILNWNASRTSPRIRFLCSRRDFWASQVFTVKKSKEVTSQSNLLRDFNLGPFTLCSITI